MTSQINPNNVDGTYPVAGQDNDSQGFRDNFTNLRNNLTFAKAEIEDLQNKAVLKSALLNTSLNNDFLGNVLVNPQFLSWRETFYNAGLKSGNYDVLFTNGNFQKITLSGSLILTFVFPSNTQESQYASIKLWINNPSAAYVLSFPNSMTLGTPSSVSGFSGNSITFSSTEISNSTDYFFEVFTFDGGTTYGIRDLTRNRDFDGNISTFSDFSANGNVLLGKTINATVGSNVVIRSNITSSSSTNQSLVVVGGAGISGNAIIDSELWIGSGNIRSSSSFANVFNITTATVSIGNAATSIFMGSSSSDIRAAGNVRTSGNTFTLGGKINSNYLLANVVTNQNLLANVNYNKFIANCSPTGTVANLFITLPNSVEDGRELEIVSLTPITACFVSNMTPGVTSVYGLANTWAGSASLTNAVMIRLMYNSTVARWFKVN